MKKELLIAFGIYILCVALARFLWHYPILLALCYLIVSIFVLYRWQTRSNLALYFIAFVLGPAAEAIEVHGRAWEYSKPFYLIPIWLPFLWGIAALLMKRLSEILVIKG